MAKTGYDRSTARLMGAEPDDDILAAELADAQSKLGAALSEVAVTKQQLATERQTTASLRTQLAEASPVATTEVPNG